MVNDYTFFALLNLSVKILYNRKNGIIFLTLFSSNVQEEEDIFFNYYFVATMWFKALKGLGG